MAEKIIKTRIALRWLEYATWSAEAFKAEKPLKGEVWFCEVPTGNANAQTAPTVLFKVGDGVNTFGDLKWSSALAADVYAWAKCSNVELDGEVLKFHNNDKEHPVHTVDLSKFALDADLEEIGRELAQLEGLVHGPQETLNTTAQTAFGGINEIYGRLGDVDTLATGNTDTVVAGVNEVVGKIGTLSDLNTTNKGNLVAAINEALQAVEVGGTGSVVTVTKAATPTTGSEATYVVNQGGKAVDVKIEIPKYATSADYGVLEVKGDNASGVVVDNTDAQRPVVKIAANTYDAHGAAAAVLGESTDGASANTVYGAKAAAAAAQNDATIAKTKIETFLGTVTPDGSQSIIDTLAEINNYVGEHGEEFAALSGKVTNIENGTTVVPKAADADTLDGHDSTYFATAESVQNISDNLGDLAGKDKIVEGDIEGTIGKDKITNFATEVAAVKVTNAGNADKAADADKLGGQLPSYYATKESVDAIPDAIDSKISAYDTGKNFGDIITHNVAEFATKAQGDKADTALQEVKLIAETDAEGNAKHSGLKVNNKNEIAIDDSIVFVLDCNW